MIIVITLSIISMDVKIFVSNKYMFGQVKGIPPRGVSPYQMQGDPNIWNYEPLNAFCESNEKRVNINTFIRRWTLIKK